jgi:predicted nucleotide-binding protein
MDKPRIFLGSSGLQKKLLDALTRGLEDVAHVEPWTTSFNPGTSTLARLFELAHEVDFAAFVFARDDWTAAGFPASPPAGSGQASPRDNVVVEAGLFGGALGMHRTSSSMRRTRSFRAISSGLHACGTAKRRPLPR